MFEEWMIEFLLLIGIFLLVYNCCFKARSRHARRSPHASGPDGSEDLRRFRARLSERGAAGGGDDEASPETSARRTALVEQNLFGRHIQRADSVRDLARLLAVSRGGAPTTPTTSTASTTPTTPDDVPDEERGEAGKGVVVAPTLTRSSSASSLPVPSAPPQAAPVDAIATAIAMAPEAPNAAHMPTRNPSLEPIRSLWSSLTSTSPARERPGSAPAAAGKSAGPSPVPPPPAPLPAPKLECSICLEPFAAGDSVAWAKDGGDPADAAEMSTATRTGCNHIFHKECLVAWLQDHDDCPLCRRTLVHADAATRFAGWEMG